MSSNSCLGTCLLKNQIIQPNNYMTCTTCNQPNILRFSPKTIDKLENLLDGISDQDLDGELTNSSLKAKLMMVGIIAYREVHNAGIPADVRFPSLNAPARVYSEILGKYVDERQIDDLEVAVMKAAKKIAKKKR